MALFKRKYENAEEVLRKAPGPSPWYLRADPPKIPEGFEWTDATDGITLLQNPNRRVVAIFDYYCYVSSVGTNRLLVWHPKNDKNAKLDVFAKSVKFQILDISKLGIITDNEAVIRQLKQEKSYVFYVCSEVTSFQLPTDLPVGIHKIGSTKEISITDINGLHVSHEIKNRERSSARASGFPALSWMTVYDKLKDGFTTIRFTAMLVVVFSLQLFRKYCNLSSLIILLSFVDGKFALIVSSEMD